MAEPEKKEEASAEDVLQNEPVTFVLGDETFEFRAPGFRRARKLFRGIMPIVSKYVPLAEFAQAQKDRGEEDEDPTLEDDKDLFYLALDSLDEMSDFLYGALDLDEAKRKEIDDTAQPLQIAEAFALVSPIITEPFIKSFAGAMTGPK